MVPPGGSQPNAADRYDSEQGVRESRATGVSKQRTSSDESMITSRFVLWAQLAPEFGSIRDAGDAGRGRPESPRMRRRRKPGRDARDGQQVAQPGEAAETSAQPARLPGQRPERPQVPPPAARASPARISPGSLQKRGDWRLPSPQITTPPRPGRTPVL